MANVQQPPNAEAFAAEVRHRLTEPFQVSQWVADAVGYAEVLARNCAGIDDRSAAAQCAVFWIRLYGILDKDMRRFFERRQELKPSPELDQVLDAIAAVRAALSHEELVYLEYRRMCDGHPFQDGYSPMGESGSALVNGRRRKDILNDATDLMRRYIPVYGARFERGVAYDVARKVLPSLSQAARIVERWRTVHGDDIHVTVDLAKLKVPKK